MKKLINILRSIDKLIFGDGLSVKYTRWKIADNNIQDNLDILFPDGIIAINSSSKVQVIDFGEKNNGKLVSYAIDLISKYGLKDGDVFIGRDSNYILFRNGSINIKTDQLNIDCNDIGINVSNAITVNGIELTFTGDKISINNKEIAVVGGDIDPVTNKITVSGQ